MSPIAKKSSFQVNGPRVLGCRGANKTEGQGQRFPQFLVTSATGRLGISILFVTAYMDYIFPQLARLFFYRRQTPQTLSAVLPCFCYFVKGITNGEARIERKTHESSHLLVRDRFHSVCLRLPRTEWDAFVLVIFLKIRFKRRRGAGVGLQ